MTTISFESKPAGTSLSVNLNAGHYRIAGKSREQGEKELHSLVTSATVEESYLFIEGTDAKGKAMAIWYEVGRQETLHQVSVTTETIKAASENLKALGITPKFISNYHIHPINTDNPDASNTISHPDYAFVVEKMPKFLKEFGNVPFDARVVVPAGVWTLSPGVYQAAETDKDNFINIYHYYMSAMWHCNREADLFACTQNDPVRLQFKMYEEKQNNNCP